MIKTVFVKYPDHQFLSVEFEIDGYIFANINIEKNKMSVEIFKILDNISLDFQDLMSKLQYAKDELLKTYPELKMK